MIEIRLLIREATTLSEALEAEVKIEMTSEASANSTEKERRIAARVRDSYNQILADVGPIIEETEVARPALPPRTIDV